jgi:two-component system sensor histidine kinase CreC
MSLATRIALLFLITVTITTTSFVWKVVDQVKPRYREAVEEPLVDIAYALAAIVASDFPSVKSTLSNGDTTTPSKTSALSGDARLAGELPTRPWYSALSALRTTKVNARIYATLKHQVDLRVYLVDEHGIVLFHSHDPDAVGQDYSQWNDVLKTLRGEYGARTSRDSEHDGDSSVLYVGAPVISGGVIRGVLTVGKPSRSVNSLVAKVSSELWKGALIALACLSILTLLLSLWITNPLRRLTHYARKVRDGKHTAAPRVEGREARELALAFEEMRVALEGKQYVEHYVQTLTHEIKSPLSAIRGAAELLSEDSIDEKNRQKFLSNITSEVRRLQSLVDRLLQLASLERRERPSFTHVCKLQALVQSAREGMEAYAESKGVTLTLSQCEDLTTLGDELLLSQAISNLIKNAIEFSPQGGTVELSLSSPTQHGASSAIIKVQDQGPGIPEYAKEKVFERFFSLPRPSTNVKSSGLGLSIVKSIAELHSGSVSLENLPHGGAEACLRLPLRR